MVKQAFLSRWFRPAGKPAPAEVQKRGIDTGHSNQASSATQPSRCVTLLDVLAALDINAVRLLVGHLEAAKWCAPAREACKALRDAVDTGASRLELSLSDGDYPVTAAIEAKFTSLLLQRPCCSRVVLDLDGCPLIGDDDDDVYCEDGEEQEGEGKAEGEEKEGCGTNDVTKCATELVTCPFRGLPLGRREQITHLKLQFTGWDRPPMLSYVLEALGLLLPGLLHLDLVHCDTCAWDWRSCKGDREVPAVLAAAFPRLEGLTLELQDSARLLPGLVTHMGSRLTKLVLIGVDDAKLQPPYMLEAFLPELVALKELVFDRLQFNDHRSESADDTLNAAETAFVDLLNALPPALEIMHIARIDLRMKDGRVEWMRGRRLEIAVRGGKAWALRMGWAVRHAELYTADLLIQDSKLGQGVERLELLQLGGLNELEGREEEESEDPLWQYVKGRFDRVDLGRLYIAYGTPAKAAAVLVQRYRPEEVAGGECVVRLRGSGLLPTAGRVDPQWGWELGERWAEGSEEAVRAVPAPGVRAAMAAARLRLETAAPGAAAAVAAAEIGRSMAAAISGGAGQRRQERRGQQLRGVRGGLVPYDQAGLEDGRLFLVAGPFVRILGSDGVVQAWVKGVSERAAAARARSEDRRHGPVQDVQCHARVTLAHVASKVGTAEGKAGTAVEKAGLGESVLLLQGSPQQNPRWLQEALGELCGAGGEGGGASGEGQQQGMSSAVQAVRMQGTHLREVLHDAYLSPVGVAWHCVARVPMAGLYSDGRMCMMAAFVGTGVSNNGASVLSLFP